MRDDDKILLYFLFCFINKKKPDEHIDIHWRNVYRLSSMHDVSAMVYSLIKRLSIEKQPDNEMLEKFRADYDYAIIRSTNQEFEMQGLIDQFVDKKIQHILFKGYCIKHYYPLPELRTMGDIDFLVHREDRKKVVKILIENGFQAESEIGDVWSYRKNKIVLELHTQMASGHYWNGYDYET